ncbi:MAG: bifunctional DNA-formamidopyrimidine glycosylase/DNA-(apurinic or apyrimidinic site) lyase [Holosporales bacterium]
MPELPEVETVLRGLIPHIQDQTIEDVIIRRPDLRWPIPLDLRERLVGHSFGHFQRRAKYMLLGLRHAPLTLIWHLGMSGRVKVVSATEPYSYAPHDHVIFVFEGGARIIFHDPRRFGSLHLTDQSPDEHPLLTHLGVEPLAADFNADYLYALCARSSVDLKSRIMDQRVVVGVGNIYASEALFRARLHPARSAHTLTLEEAGLLVGAIKDVLLAAIHSGGSSLRDHAQVSGEMGYFQHQFAVYDREGLLCGHCQAMPICRIVQKGRSTFYCPTCQEV